MNGIAPGGALAQGTEAVICSQPTGYSAPMHAGDAKDAARILSLTEHAEVPYGRFDQLLMTEETTPLEPDLRERKYYARGIGLVFAEVVSGGTSREELISYLPRGTV